MNPKHAIRVEAIVNAIRCPRWELWVSPVTAERKEGTEKSFFEIGASSEQQNVDGSDYVFVRGFSQLLPEWAEDTTIVEAAYDLIERLHRHELREFYTYRGTQILNPHKLPKPKKAATM